MSPCASLGRSLYRLYDPDPTRGCHAVASWAEADKWNRDKWAVFWTVNEFEGARKIENLKRLLSFYADLDSGSKDDQRGAIQRHILPSMIIGTARGFHPYWDIEGECDAETYAQIQERIIFALGGDPKAKDIARILRVPTYLHWKDPNNPIAIKYEFGSEKKYTPEKMLKFFLKPEEKEKFEQKKSIKREMSFLKNDDLFERIYSLHCGDALNRLSGHAAVGFETYTFKRMGNGNLNILVNGKSTSCFVDRQGRIGSGDKGGPTIWQWIYWFHRDHKKVFEYMKEVFPEVINAKVS